MERAKKIARAEAARKMLDAKGFRNPVIYSKVAMRAPEASKAAPNGAHASKPGEATTEAQASEVNTLHNHTVGKLGLKYKEDVTERDDGQFECRLLWTFPDKR